MRNTDQILTLEDYTLHLHPDDQVAIVKHDLSPGMELTLSDGGGLVVREHIPAGHKMALCDIPSGKGVSRYGYFIGQATAFIPAGSWVHTHNLAFGGAPGHDAGSGEYAVGVVDPIQPIPSGKSFLGLNGPTAGQERATTSLSFQPSVARLTSPARSRGHFHPSGWQLTRMLTVLSPSSITRVVLSHLADSRIPT